MGVVILEKSDEWQYCFIVSSSILILMVLLNFWLLDPYPNQIGFSLVENDGEEDKNYK
jgi:sugar phosphate permease